VVAVTGGEAITEGAAGEGDADWETSGALVSGGATNLSVKPGWPRSNRPLAAIPKATKRAIARSWPSLLLIPFASEFEFLRSKNSNTLPLWFNF
jgi:hypothetical protein